MERKTCKYCKKRLTARQNNRDGVCSACHDKHAKVHELYLTCQLVRKSLGLTYDRKLDEERYLYQKNKRGLN